MKMKPRRDPGAITDVRLGKYRAYEDSKGDTWDPAWGADGALYFAGNDGSGWDKACSSNVFFNRADGDDPFALTGRTVSPMSDLEGWAKKGPDNCSWKSMGTLSLDGVLYLAISRHKYGTDSGDPAMRQKADRASIVKSSDGGVTWAPSGPECYEKPMFTSPRFGTPYFLHYGRDGKAPSVHNAEKYIYATSNNGFWCNGDNYILGRVAREKFPRLESADWEFYTGGDGMLSMNWSPDMGKARPIVADPLKCGEAGATYVPSLKRYVLVAWYYPGNPTIDANDTRFVFWEGPRPWGPWTKVREERSHPEGWYCPRILAKWQKASGRITEAVLVAGGDYYEPDRHYRFTVVPVRLKAGGRFPPPPPEPGFVAVGSWETTGRLNSFSYEGDWARDNTRAGAHGGIERRSDKAGDSFTVRFKGRRLKWYASKENNLGIAAVSVDGGKDAYVDLFTYCAHPQYGRLLHDTGDLRRGVHTFKVTVTGRKNEVFPSAGAAITNDHVEIF